MGHTGETPGWGTPTWNGRKIHYLQRDLDAKANRVPSGFSIIACWEWLPLMVQRERKAREVIKGYAKIFQKILKTIISVQFTSITQSCPTLWPNGLQHTRPPCPSPTPRVYSNSYPLSPWCYPTISSSVIPFSSCPQSFRASGSFQMSQFFSSGGQNTGVSASTSVLTMNIQEWFLLGWTGWISLQSKGLSRVFSNTSVQKHQFFGTQLSLQFNSHNHTWLLEKP